VHRTGITRGALAPRLVAALGLAAAPWLVPVPVAAQAAPPPAGKMWLLEDPPVDYIHTAYGVDLSADWLGTTRLSGLRFGGGTASFVSAHGLILTNHHVVRGNLSLMEHEGHNLGVTGYVAHSREEELQIPGASVSQLIHTEDVTEEMFRGVDLSDSAEEVKAALGKNRQGVLARAAREFPGMATELVSLYRGARVHLYVYKSYSDVRLAFAPELGTGYFGGDTDNFRYPRFTLDFSLCRVYENGEPIDSSAFHFGWSDEPLAEGAVVFSLGNPGSTDRLLTVAELEYRRDVLYPAQTAIIDDFLRALEAYAGEHPESADRLRELGFGTANGQKATLGKLQGLRDETRMKARRVVEEDLRARLAADPQLDAQYGDAWDEIELALEELTGVYERWWYQTPWYGQGRWFRPLARAVGLVEELCPDFLDEHRMPPQGTELAYPFEPEVYAKHLLRGREVLGADDPGIQAVLRGMEPLEAVQKMVAETRIGQREFEDELRKGGWEAVEACEDPAIAAARELYPLLVDNQDQKKLMESVITHHAMRVGKAIDALEGPVVCPEATFSQRLSAGRVRGYSIDGHAFPASTRFEGMFERCAQFGDTGEFDLPDRWFEHKDALDLETPLDFVCTVDSTGGSSGSPIFDARRRIVGVLFDGNEQGTENEFVFQDGAARAIAVHSVAMLEALEAVYEAPNLVAELRGE